MAIFMARTVYIKKKTIKRVPVLMKKQRTEMITIVDAGQRIALKE